MHDFVKDVQARLTTRHVGTNITMLEEVESTNIPARRALVDGAPEGSVFFAEYQTQGRGRLGRQWLAERGVNLLFSTIVRPQPELLGLTGILASVALRKALLPYVSPLDIQIKWPNDLIIDGLKCSGMLMENVSGGIVLGIGLNVNQSNFPDAARAATSLLLATGRRLPRADLLASILNELEEHLIDVDVETAREAIRDFERHMFKRGERVSFYTTAAGAKIVGRIIGIQSDGALRLMTPKGERSFYSGDISTQPIYEER